MEPTHIFCVFFMSRSGESRVTYLKNDGSSAAKLIERLDGERVTSDAVDEEEGHLILDYYACTEEIDISGKAVMIDSAIFIDEIDLM